MLCRKELKRVNNTHLQAEHGITVEDYDRLIARLPNGIKRMRSCHKRTFIINMVARRILNKTVMK